jgi:hypothetical protein
VFVHGQPNRAGLRRSMSMMMIMMMMMISIIMVLALALMPMPVMMILNSARARDRPEFGSSARHAPPLSPRAVCRRAHGRTARQDCLSGSPIGIRHRLAGRDTRLSPERPGRMPHHLDMLDGRRMAHLVLVELESTPLDHSDKLSLAENASWPIARASHSVAG